MNIIKNNNKYLKNLFDLIDYFIYTIKNSEETEFIKYCGGSGNISSDQVIRRFEKFIYSYNYKFGYQKRYKITNDEDDEDICPYDYPVYKYADQNSSDIYLVGYIDIQNLNKDTIYIKVHDENFNTIKCEILTIHMKPVILDNETIEGGVIEGEKTNE